MEASTQHSTSALLKAVESLKNNGLAGIGKVVATSPEYLDATSFSQDSQLVTATSHVDDDEYNNNNNNKNPTEWLLKPRPLLVKKNSSDQSGDGMSIYVNGESVSHLGSMDGTRSISQDAWETVSIASVMDIESAETATTEARTPSPPLSLTALNAPTPDSNFSLDVSTSHCSRGKELWANNQCQEAVLEFRKALLGLESLLGTHHVLVSRLYYWMGQIYLQMLHKHDEQQDSQGDDGNRRRALADAAVESLSWSLKIRYTQPSDAENGKNKSKSKDDDDNNNNIYINIINDNDNNNDDEISGIEDSLKEALKLQTKGLPLGISSHSQKSKTVEPLKESIKIERKADLALFRMEKNRLSQAIDVYVSLVNQYNKAISVFPGDGGFSSMTKMAFWYHKLGRLRATMDGLNDSDTDDESDSSYQSFNSAPLDQTEHSKANQQQAKAKKNHTKSISLTYLEQAAFWYRMALEVFCTGIGRFDKVREEHSRAESIDVTAHPTYQQLLLRIGQVLSDHSKKNKHYNKERHSGDSYLKSLGVLESVFHHYAGKEAMKYHQKFNIKLVDSLPQLQRLRENLTKAEDGFSESLAIEEATWGKDHQIVVRMRHELSRASRLKYALDLEITAFPAKQAMKEKQKQQQEEEEREKKRQEREENRRVEELTGRQKFPRASAKGFSRDSSKRSRMDRSREPKSKIEELLGNVEVGPFQSRRLPQLHQRRQHQQQRRKAPTKQTPVSPSGSRPSLQYLPNNAIETLRRLQNEVYDLQKLQRDLSAERDDLRSQLESKTSDFLQAVTSVGRNEEEFQTEKEALQNRIKELESKQYLSLLEFEGGDLLQSEAQKEVELEYWRQKFEAAQAEWTECQTSLEAELRNARSSIGSREADVIEWRGKFEGIHGEWKSCQDQVKRLQDENLRLQNEVTSGLAERKQLEFSKKMNDLESAQKKEHQLVEAMDRVTKSESEAASWKRKYDVAQKEWLAIQGKADENTREAIADVNIKTAELSRWKKKFEIAQREWTACQTRVEGQARVAIATAKQYEVSNSELTEKFAAAQNSLQSLSEHNKALQKQLDDNQSKKDQLEFTLKKQAIDFANINETLNRKTAEAQIWKEQCQTQKQISHEIQFSRAANGSMQDRIAELLRQNADLKKHNRELQVEQENRKLEVEAKNKEVALVKQAALQRIRQLKDEKKKLKSASGSIKDATVESDFVDYQDPSNPSSLAAKLGRAQRALEYVQKDNKESKEEIESLKIAKKNAEGNLAKAQNIVSMLRTTNSERIEQYSKLEIEKHEVQKKLDQIIAEKERFATSVGSLASGRSESQYEKDNEELRERLSALKSDLQKSELRNDELLSDLKKERLRSKSSSGRSTQVEDEKSEDDEQTKILKDRCEVLERELAVSKKQVEDLKDKFIQSPVSNGSGRYQDKINYLLKHCEGMERDIVIANHQIEDLEDELRAYREQGDNGYEKNEYHDMILAQDLERKLEESNQIQQDLSSALKTFEGKVELAEEKEKELKKQLGASNDQIKSLRNSVRDLTKLNLSQHKDANSDKQNLAVIEDLEEELEASNEIREKLEAELKVCKEELVNAEQKKEEHQWLSDEYRVLEEKLEESNQIREEMASKMSPMKQRLLKAEKLESESESLENKLSELEQELEETSEQNKRLKSQIDTFRTASGNEDGQRKRIVDKVLKLENELGQRAQEIKSLKKERDKVTEDLEDLEEENEELIAKYEKLQKQYKGTRRQAEQSSRNLSALLNTENKEQERVRQKYAKLELDLEEMTLRNKELESKVHEMNEKTPDSGLEMDLREMSKRNKELESRVDEMRKRNIQNLKLEKDFEKLSERNKELESRINGFRGRSFRRLDGQGSESCQQCLVIGEELRSTIEQNEKHILATEKFQDEHDQLLDRYNVLEEELKEAIEQNEILESQMITKENNSRDDRLDEDEKYQDLNVRCIELEEQLRDSNELNEKKTAQLASLKTKVCDLEAYADETASDLEHAESLLAALKAQGVGGGAEITLLMGRCNQLQNELKEAHKTAERMRRDLTISRKENSQINEELNDSINDLVVNINLDDEKAGTIRNDGVKELKEDLDRITIEKEELEKLLKKATEESEKEKRLKGHVEKDRDYLEKVYNECKSDMARVQNDLDVTKELLKKSNDENEELERQLQIEKHVSSSLKTSQKRQEMDESEENELEELYRQARDELTEVEGMLFETEEELEILKAKYQKLEEESKNPSSTKEEEEEINHDLHDLSRDELMKETQKALRKMQETQFKVVDLQETNMILQAQLKSSLTFKEKSKVPARRRNNNSGERGGFWSLGNGNAAAKNGNDENAKNGENGNGEGRFAFLRGRGRRVDANNNGNTSSAKDEEAPMTD